MKAKIKLEVKGKVIELEIDEAKELAEVLAEMTGIKLKEVERIIERHHDHYHDRWWYPYTHWSDTTTTWGSTEPYTLTTNDKIMLGYTSV
jgi:hypothetical protein